MPRHTYRVVSGTGGARPWRVIYEGDLAAALGVAHIEIVDARGRLRRWASLERASAAAAAWNAASVPPGDPPDSWCRGFRVSP